MKAEENEKKKKNKNKPKKAVSLKRLTWFDALVHGVRIQSAKGAVPELLAVAGML